MEELKELKSGCGIHDDEALLEKLIRFRQRELRGVAKNKSIGFLAATLTSSRYE